MVTCSLCDKLAIASIPTLNEPLNFCASHMGQLSKETIETLFRDTTPDTLLYLLGFVQKSVLLEIAMQAQAQEIQEMGTATKFNLVESLQQDRDGMQEQVEELEGKLVQAQSELVALQEENKKLTNIHALLEEHRNAISSEITGTKTDILARIEEATEFFETISTDIQGMQDILTREEEEQVKPKKLKKEEKPEIQQE